MIPSYNDYKILIVDSSVMIVDRLNGLLKELDGKNYIASANTYGEAVEKLVSDEFDIALFDTQLPGKDGFELLSFIKGNYPQMKTIMFTNQVSYYHMKKGKGIGTDHYIDKSTEFEKLVEIIKDYSNEYQKK